MSPKMRVDVESMVRLRTSGFRPHHLLVVVFGLVCFGLLVVSPTAREYVTYEKLKVEVEAEAEAESVSVSAAESYPVEPPPNAPVNVTITPAIDLVTQRANATLLMLARNSDLSGVEQSMHSLEAQFNHRHHYQWTFLNEVPFTLEFKQRVRKIASGEVRFGLIKSEHWYPPDWIDDERYEQSRKAMEALGYIPYAGSMSYRNMCRFNSGFFFRHNLLKDFKWYWRVEPHVHFPCVVPDDPFAYMIEHNKRYSFTISFTEYGETIPTLWDAVKDFMSKYSHLIPENNALDYLSDDGGYSYNRCHFWSNFEIADLDFLRSPAYQAFFSHLDITGNFYYERWGDAPVHSIAVGLLLPREQIHYFNDMGYLHPPYWNCPDEPLNSELNCHCRRDEAFDANGQICMDKFRDLFPGGVAG